MPFCVKLGKLEVIPSYPLLLQVFDNVNLAMLQVDPVLSFQDAVMRPTFQASVRQSRTSSLLDNGHAIGVPKKLQR